MVDRAEVASAPAPCEGAVLLLALPAHEMERLLGVAPSHTGLQPVPHTGQAQTHGGASGSCTRTDLGKSQVCCLLHYSPGNGARSRNRTGVACMASKHPAAERCVQVESEIEWVDSASPAPFGAAWISDMKWSPQRELHPRPWLERPRVLAARR